MEKYAPLLNIICIRLKKIYNYKDLYAKVNVQNTGFIKGNILWLVLLKKISGISSYKHIKNHLYYLSYLMRNAQRIASFYGILINFLIKR